MKYFGIYIGCMFYLLQIIFWRVSVSVISITLCEVAVSLKIWCKSTFFQAEINSVYVFVYDLCRAVLVLPWWSTKPEGLNCHQSAISDVYYIPFSYLVMDKVFQQQRSLYRAESYPRSCLPVFCLDYESPWQLDFLKHVKANTKIRIFLKMKWMLDPEGDRHAQLFQTNSVNKVI